MRHYAAYTFAMMLATSPATARTETPEVILHGPLLISPEHLRKVIEMCPRQTRTITVVGKVVTCGHTLDDIQRGMKSA